MRRDMIANVSHELRTPVSALQAMVENMADGVTEPLPPIWRASSPKRSVSPISSPSYWT